MIPTILNVNPRMNRRPPDPREVALILGDAGEVIPTHSLEALEQAAKALAESSPKVIAIWGGDGTIGATISALVRAFGSRLLPELCLLPGGTMSCIARCIGAYGSPGSMLARLKLALEEGREIPRARAAPRCASDRSTASSSGSA